MELMNKEGKHTEDELVKKHEIPLVQSIEDSQKDVSLKNELIGCMQEELTPEAKISNQKIEENMEENHTILRKNPNDSDQNGTITIKEDKASREPY
ncbi:hypothetical protein L1987_83000 [Smallanthus sonchifolius]|uniref:Uncharacterized protein n=1 Tax=Smallanthus sonchifolius TaxID=185202 RepID=A0ACB8YC23_9ASTR|nr:hypothetical protein L1987_83000 [Smallanthus sonchifolius]